MTQKERVLKILKRRPNLGVTSGELRELFTFDANRRLRELREEYDIVANKEPRPGYKKPVNVYRLRGETCLK